METAYRVYSWKGILKEDVVADKVTSRQSARRLGPFYSLDIDEVVAWVRSVWVGTRKVRKAYFRRFPNGFDLTESISTEFERLKNKKKKSRVSG